MVYPPATTHYICVINGSFPLNLESQIEPLVFALQASSLGLIYLSVYESFDGGRPSAVVEDGQLSKQFAGSHLTTKLVVLCHLDITLWEVRRG